MLNRKQALEHLRKGWPVLHGGRQIANKDLLPKDVEGEPALSFVPTRFADGNLNMAGMKAIIARGGSVQMGGKAITSAADLPDEVTLAAGDAAKLDAVAEQTDKEIAALIAHRESIRKARQASQESREAGGEDQSPPAGPTPPATAGAGQSGGEKFGPKKVEQTGVRKDK